MPLAGTAYRRQMGLEGCHAPKVNEISVSVPVGTVLRPRWEYTASGEQPIAPEGSEPSGNWMEKPTGSS